jgi:hypothetical protein
LFLSERFPRRIIDSRRCKKVLSSPKPRREEIESRKGASMNVDPDPFELGERAARQNIPAEANPYQDGSEAHALWAAGHEKVAGAREANESEGT